MVQQEDPRGATQPEPPPVAIEGPLSDRELLGAVLAAVGALAQRLTGRPLVLRVPTRQGYVMIELAGELQ